ncbi:hypothetical protein [Streptomyces sp. NPDC046887]|uniref:hypothetical protein n=1 Tax=Streptomyces sp. NPDC046887 TaxID=3155472 RepID=UPI0033E96D6A
MGRFDLGIFVDAHYLFDVDPQERSASVVLPRIEAAAEEQCMSYGMADRLVVADCADTRARGIAEDFARQGFVIRHIPADSPLTRAGALTAEIVEAAVGREDLRTVAVVAEPGVALSVADTLHRAGRALIACTAGQARGGPAVDRVITFTLDRSELRRLVARAVAGLREAGREEVGMAEFAVVLRGLQPGFSAGDYGAPLKKLLQRLAGPDYRFAEPDRILLRSAGAAGGAREKAPGGAEAGSGHWPDAAPSLISVMREAALVLPLIEPTDEAAVVKALRSVLDLASERGQLREAALGEGLPIQVVAAGLRVVAEGYRDLGHKTSELCRQATAGTAWQVAHAPGNPKHLLVRLTRESAEPG